MSFVWKYFEICAQDTGSRSALEVQSYMSEAQIAGSEQPLVYWRTNKSPFQRALKLRERTVAVRALHKRIQ